MVGANLAKTKAMKQTLILLWVIAFFSPRLQAQKDTIPVAKIDSAQIARQLLSSIINANAADFTRLAPPATKNVFVDFVGSGDIQKSLSEGRDINANTGLGIIFERFKGEIENGTFKAEKLIQSYEIEASINIATTADTINSTLQNNVLQNRRSYGTYVLNPVSAKQSLFINSNIYFGYPDKLKKLTHWISGLNLRIISSNNVWRYDTLNTNLGVLALRAGIFHEFFPDDYRLNEDGQSRYSLFLGVNYAFRGIYGDISSPSKEDIRTKILGSKQTRFHGVEFNFGFRLNNIRAEFQMPILSKKAESIEGLTNTQFLFSVRFVGGFSLKLRDGE